jgi:FkbM family methyltransferase
MRLPLAATKPSRRTHAVSIQGRPIRGVAGASSWQHDHILALPLRSVLRRVLRRPAPSVRRREVARVNAVKRGLIAVFQRCLPCRVKRSLFHLSYHLARGEFERFAHHYAHAPHMELGLTGLARRFPPATMVDVGAFEGGWSGMVRRIWPASRMVMVEPNVAKQPALRELAAALPATLHCELLGARDGEQVSFHVMESGSSVLAERSGVPRTMETRTLRTLDALLGSPEGPVLLKIDAQGYELRILEGAPKLLARAEAVLLEVALIEINEGAPLLHDVVAFMKAREFVAYDVLEIHRRPLDGALNQVDVLFVREQSALIADKRHYA